MEDRDIYTYNPSPEVQEIPAPANTSAPHDPHDEEDIQEKLLLTMREMLNFLYMYRVSWMPSTGINVHGGVEMEWDCLHAHIVINLLPDEEAESYSIEYAVINRKSGQNRGGSAESMHELAESLKDNGVWEMISERSIP